MNLLHQSILGAISAVALLACQNNTEKVSNRTGVAANENTALGVSGPKEANAGLEALISWSAVVGAKDYSLAISTDSRCDVPEFKITGVTATFQRLTFSRSSVFYVCVTAKDSRGEDMFLVGAPHKITVKDSKDAIAPTVGTIQSPSLITPVGFTISWSASKDNADQAADLQYQLCSSTTRELVETVDACQAATLESQWINALSASVTGKSPSTTYFVNVLVKDKVGNIAVYDAKSVATIADTTAPVAGNAGQVTFPAAGILDQSLTLQWTTASDDATPAASLLYEVRRSTANNLTTIANAEANGTLVQAYTANLSTLTVSSLSQSTQYYFSVIVKDAAGNKSLYNAASQSTAADTTVPTISVSEPNGTGDSIAAGTSFNIALSGADSDDAATISLYYNYGSAGCSTGLAGWTQIVSGLAENTTTYSWNTTGLGIGTRYICSVITDGVNPAVHSVSPGPITFTGDLVLGANAYINSSGRLISDSGSTVLLGASSGDGSPSTPFVFNISGNLDMGNYTIRGAYDSSTSQHAATWIVTGNISGTGSFDSFTTGNHQWGGNVRLEAGGSIAIKRVVSSMVFRWETPVGGGDVYLWAKNGAVTITEAIDTRAGGGGQDGGDVTIRSEGSGSAIAIQSAYTGEDGLNHSILAEGYGAFVGGHGGTVALYTPGAITLSGGISARSGRVEYDGGNGGSITIRGDLSDSNLRAGAVSIGGTGGILSKSDRRGSAGGTVTVKANSLAVTANIVTYSFGGFSTSPGNVDINVLTTCTIGGYIDARLRDYIYTSNYPGSVSITGRNIAINGVDADGFSIRTWPENGFRYSQDLTPTNAGNITLTGIDTSTAHYEFPSRTSGATSSVVVAGKIESGRFFHDGSMGNIAISAVEVQLGGDVTINTPSAASTLTINYGVTTYGMHRHLVENNTRWNGTSGHGITYSVSGGTLAFNANVAYAGIRIPGLYNTGVDDNGVALGNSGTDTHWKVYNGATLLGDAKVVYEPGWGGSGVPGAWAPMNLSGADQGRWIWENQNGTPASTRVVRTSFDLTGINPDTVVISFSGANDASRSDIYVNGVYSGKYLNNMGNFLPVNIASNFVSGINTLDFEVFANGTIDGLLIRGMSATGLPASNGIGTLFSTMMRGTVVPGSWTADNAAAYSVNDNVPPEWGGTPHYNWINSNSTHYSSIAAGTYTFRQTFTLTQSGTSTGDLITWTTAPSFAYAADNIVDVYIDNVLGSTLLSSRSAAFSTETVNLSSYLVSGSNTIRIVVENTASGPSGLYVGDILGRFVP